MKLLQYTWALLGVAILVVACVDPDELMLQSKATLLVVDGTITNLAEPQVIRLNYSQADRLTGQFYSKPISQATVVVVVDSLEQIACHETVEGSYQLPSDFKGQIGHAYQLQITLSDGTQYRSTQQIMQPVPTISRVSAQFSQNALATSSLANYSAGHVLYVDTQDPANQRNYYRWEWRLYERQYWCKSCTKGVYSFYKILPGIYKDNDYFVTGTEPLEACFTPSPGQAQADAPEVPAAYWIYDYPCRTNCWEILYGYDNLVFDDALTNGRLLAHQPVARIPFYNSQPALVDMRQLSLPADAYHYFKLFADQTEHTGGLADTPPTALPGNVSSVQHKQQAMVGYFTASAVSQVHYWLDRKDARGVSYGEANPIDTLNSVPVDTLLAQGVYRPSWDGLFFALNSRQPSPEPPPPYLTDRLRPKVRLWPNADRPPTAICVPSDTRTPYKPDGWRD